MKKLFTREKWKQHSAARSRYQKKAAIRFRIYRKKENVLAGPPRPRRYKKDSSVRAPEVCSFLQNPNETIQFFNKLKILSRDRNVSVDLSGVTTITPDAIAGLVAMIHRFNEQDALIEGNVPRDRVARSMIEHSGFRDYVKTPGWAPARVLMGKVRKRSRSRDTVEIRYNQQVTTDLIAFATEKLTGSPRANGPSYSNFGEAMLNTLNHASATSQPEPWWASVYFDADRKRACFTFIDQGIGIFRSHRLTATLKLVKTLSILSSADILKKILQGEVRSTTRVEGRGNGLPGMYKHCKAGRIRNFTVLANDAIGNAETDEYRSLRTSFAGTLLYWEIEV